MARRKDKDKAQAIKMRLEGASYSQIKQKVDVSKSSLSNWLRDFPLSEKRIRELRDNNPRRIERFRNTMKEKREAKLRSAYKKAKDDIGRMTKRERFIAGLFLYWGEGSKSADTEISISNTDPATILFFKEWLIGLGVREAQMKVRLHLYSDMNISKETRYWSKTLGLPLGQFRKPYIKRSQRSGITWKKSAEHGTCNLLYHNKPLYDYVIMSLKRLREMV